MVIYHIAFSIIIKLGCPSRGHLWCLDNCRFFQLSTSLFNQSLRKKTKSIFFNVSLTSKERQQKCRGFFFLNVYYSSIQILTLILQISETIINTDNFPSLEDLGGENENIYSSLTNFKQSSPEDEQIVCVQSDMRG